MQINSFICDKFNFGSIEVVSMCFAVKIIFFPGGNTKLHPHVYPSDVRNILGVRRSEHHGKNEIFQELS